MEVKDAARRLASLAGVVSANPALRSILLESPEGLRPPLSGPTQEALAAAARHPQPLWRALRLRQVGLHAAVKPLTRPFTAGEGRVQLSHRIVAGAAAASAAWASFGLSGAGTRY